MDRILCLILTFSLVIWSTPVWAEGDGVALPSRDLVSSAADPGTVGVPAGPAASNLVNDAELEARIQEVVERRSAAFKRTSKKTEIAGGAIVGGGFALGAVAGGIVCAQGGCTDKAWAGIGGGVGGIIGIGLITLTAGVLKRKAAEREMESVNGELNELLRQRVKRAPLVDARLSVGEENMLTLRWRF